MLTSIILDLAKFVTLLIETTTLTITFQNIEDV